MVDDLHDQVPSADGLYKYVDDTTTYEVVRKNLASQAQTIVDEISRWSNRYTSSWRSDAKLTRSILISQRLLIKSVMNTYL